MRPPNRLQAEQEHHKKAFEVYATQSGKRSYERVATELGVSVSSVKHWSRTFGWKSRLREWDAAAARQAADRALHADSRMHERNLRIVRGALMRTAQDIAQGRVKPQMGDLDRLIHLEEHLVAQRQALATITESSDPQDLIRQSLELIVLLMGRFPGGLEMLSALVEEPAASEGTGA